MGNNNATGAPQFVADYCNGARSGNLLPEVTTIQAAPALDEGGNWIDVRYGPISLTGDYHIGATLARTRTGAPVAAARPDATSTGSRGRSRCSRYVRTAAPMRGRRCS